MWSAEVPDCPEAGRGSTLGVFLTDSVMTEVWRSQHGSGDPPVGLRVGDRHMGIPQSTAQQPHWFHILVYNMQVNNSRLFDETSPKRKSICAFQILNTSTA